MNELIQSPEEQRECKLTYEEVQVAILDRIPLLVAELTEDARGYPKGTEVKVQSVGQKEFNQIMCRIEGQSLGISSERLTYKIDRATENRIKERAVEYSSQISSSLPIEFSVELSPDQLLKKGILSELNIKDTDLLQQHVIAKISGKEIVVVEHTRLSTFPFTVFTFKNFTTGVEYLDSHNAHKSLDPRWHGGSTIKVYVADLNRLMPLIKR